MMKKIFGIFLVISLILFVREALAEQSGYARPTVMKSEKSMIGSNVDTKKEAIQVLYRMGYNSKEAKTIVHSLDKKDLKNLVDKKYDEKINERIQEVIKNEGLKQDDEGDSKKESKEESKEVKETNQTNAIDEIDEEERALGYSAPITPIGYKGQSQAGVPKVLATPDSKFIGTSGITRKVVPRGKLTK